MWFTKQKVDTLALDLTALGLELGSLNPAQLRTIDQQVAARSKPKLVVKGAPLRDRLLRKSRLTSAPITPAPVLAPRGLTHGEISERLQKAAREGLIDWDLTARSQTQPTQTLKLIPHDVRETYGIPVSLGGTLNKSTGSDAEPLSRGDIQMRLERAVQSGAVAPQLLGTFARNPDHALQQIPGTIRDVYGLPESGCAPERKL